MCACRAAEVSCFWSEKLWLILHFGQLHGLLWAMSIVFPFPAKWLNGTIFTLVLTLDFPALASWADSTSYPTVIHAAVVIALPWVLAAGYLSFARRVRARGDVYAWPLSKVTRLGYYLGATRVPARGVSLHHTVANIPCRQAISSTCPS